MFTEKQSILVVNAAPLAFDDVTASLQDLAADIQDRHLTTTSEFEAVLSEQAWDAILYTFDTNSLAALQTAQAVRPATPFIFLAHTVSVPVVVDLMRAGARGFVDPADHQKLAVLLRQELAQPRQMPTGDYYRDVVDQQLEFICRYDTDFRLTFVNRAYCEWQGLPAESLIGESILKRIPVEVQERAVARVRSLSVEKPISVSIYPSILPNGTNCLIEWTDRALFDSQGQVIEYQGSGRDVTRREQARQQLHALKEEIEAQRNLFRDVLDTMQDALISVEHPNHENNFTSAAFERVFGYPAERFLKDQQFYKQVIHPDDVERVVETMQACLRDGFGEIEHRIIWPDGQVRWLHRRTWVIFDAEGRPIRVNDSAYDITERKAAEAVLRASEEKYRSLIESSDASISTVDYDGRYLYCNAIAAESFGISPEALVGKTVFDLFLPNEAAEILADVRRVIDDEQGIVFEPEITVDGRSRWFRTSIQPVRDGAGKAYAALIHAAEITEKKLAEQAIRQQNEILQQSRDLIAMTDSSGRIIYLNKAGAALLGVDDPQTLNGRSLAEFHESDTFISTVFPTAAQTGRWNGETRVRAADGRLIPVDTTFFPIRDESGAITHYATIMVDISEKKRTESLLRLLQAAVVNTSDGITITDAQLNVVFVNPAVTTLTGYSADEIVGQNSLVFLKPDSRQNLFSDFLGKISTGQHLHGELKSERKDGRPLYLEWTTSPIHDEAGEVVNYATIMRDITARKLAEQALRVSEERFRRLIEAAPVAIILSDKDGTITGVNDQAYRIFGYEQGELLHKSIDLLVPESNQRAHAALRDAFMKNPQRRHMGRRDVQAVHKDGRLFPVEIELGYLQDGDDIIVMSFLIDSSERKKAQATLEYQANLLRQVSDAIVATDNDLRITAWNAAATHIYGWTEEEALGQRLDQLLKTEWLHDEQAEAQTILAMTGQWRGELRQYTKSGQQRVVLASMSVLHNDGKPTGGIMVSHDITKRKRQETLQMRITQILEAVAEAQPLASVLEVLALAIEEYEPELRVSVMLLDQVSEQLRYIAAPNIPAGFREATNYLQIGPTVGSCGTAAYRKQLVVAEDIQNDPLWIGYRELAAAHGLGASWSHPIVDTNGKVLGTLALYYAQPQRPTVAELDLIRMAAHLAGIAVRRKLAEDALRASEDLFRRFMQHLTGTIVIYNHEDKVVYCNDRYAESMEQRAADIIGKSVETYTTPELEKAIRAENEAVLTQNKVFENDYSSTSHGVVTHWRTIKFPIPQEDAPPLVGAIAIDVSKEKVAEYALRASEEKYRSLIESSNAMIAMFNANGEMLFANKIAAQSMGTTPEKLIGEPLAALFPPSIAETHLRSLQQVIETGTGIDVENRSFVQGEERWYRTSIQPVRDAFGKITAALVHATDITRFKAAEAALRQSEEQFRLFMRYLPGSVFIRDIEERIVYCNTVYADNFNTTPEELIGRRIFDYAAAESVNLFAQEDKELLANGSVREIDHVFSGRDGMEHWKIIKFPIPRENQPPLLGSIGLDMTREKRAEDALRASEARQRAILEAIPDLMFRSTLDGTILDYHAPQEQLLYVPPEQFIGKQLEEVCPPEVVEQYRAALNRITATGCPAQYEYQLPLQGQLHDFEARVVAIGDDEFLSIIRDVTERKQAEAALQAAHDQLERRVAERTAELEGVKNRIEAIFNHSGDGILLINLEHGIQQANHAFERLLGVSEGDYLGFPLTTFVHPDDAADTEMTIHTVIDLHEKRQMELRAKRADGTFVDVEISVAPINHSEAGITNLVGIIRDISERKQAQRAIAEERNLLRTLIDTVPDYIYAKNRQHQFVLTNAGHDRVIRFYNPIDPIGKTDFDFFPPELAAEFQASDRLVFETEQPFVNGIQELLLPDGNTLWVLTTKVPLRNLNGNVIGLVGTTHDITPLKESEAALRRSEADLRSVIDSTSTAFLLMDLEGVIRVANKLAQETCIMVYGRTLEVGSSIFDYIPSKYQPRFRQHLDRAVSGETLITEEPIGKGNSQLFFEARYFPVVTPDGEIIGVNLAFENITERKKAEAALKQKHQDELAMQGYLRALHEASIELARTESLDEFYRLTVELGKSHFGFERMGMYLYEDGEVVGTYGSDAEGRTIAKHHLRFDPEVLKQTMERSRRFAFSETAQLYDNETFLGVGSQIVAALWDTELLGWLKVDNGVHRQPITQPQLDILSLYAMTVGVLFARKRAEQTALSLSRRLDLATRSGGIGIWEWDIENNTLHWDDRMYALYGLVRDEKPLTPEVLQRLVHPDDLSRTTAETYTLLNERHVYNTEYRIIRPNGEIRHIKATGIATYDNDGRQTHMIGVNLDMTEIKRSEEALRRALEKERELGELKSRFVSMASHEFRTPLAAILAATESLTHYRDKMDAAQINARLNKIRQHVNHMKRIMEDVLQLARIQAERVDFRPTNGDLDAVCKDIIEELDEQAAHQGRIIYTSTHSPLRATFDEQLIRQAVNNLVSNALKYSPIEKPVYLHLSLEATSITITVIDDGIGIPIEDQKHLFKPFHRARNVGTISGTGLGLSITKQAVDLHSGTISVQSEAGAGATFIVTLPTDLLRDNEND
jgi:PAS domain S-box-containing protein